MSIGSKLQAAHAKVAGKLGQQDGPVIFRKRTHTGPAAFGKAYTTSAVADVTVASGIKVSRITAQQVDAGGVWQVNDLRLAVPGHLVTEAQLSGADIVYGDAVYAIVTKAPTDIISGVAVLWDVVARIKP